MDESAKRWLAKTASKNLWRVQPFYDYEDLVQEGFWIFYKVKRRYPKVNKRHLMALFYRSYSNHITYLAESRTKRAEILSCDMSDADNYLDVWDNVCYPQQTEVLIAHAPKPVAKLLRALEDDNNLIKLRRPYRQRLAGRETFNERLCKIIGLDATSIDLAGMLRQYLESS